MLGILENPFGPPLFMHCGKPSLDFVKKNSVITEYVEEMKHSVVYSWPHCKNYIINMPCHHFY